MLICMHDTPYKNFWVVFFQLYLTKTLDMTITYNMGSFITRVPYVAPNISVIKAFQCTSCYFAYYQPKLVYFRLCWGI